MPRGLTEIELAKRRLFKSARAAIRLNYSIKADDELNRILPELEEHFDTAVLNGELPDQTAYNLVQRLLSSE